MNSHINKYGVLFLSIVLFGAFSSLVFAGPDTEKIPQPDLRKLERPLPVAPDSKRIDITKPVFSNPTNITSVLFPVNTISQTILLGNVDGTPFQVLYTLLPESKNKTVHWDGKKIEVRTLQYAAYHGRRIKEVALDWYAQADDGSVWYFGEDVKDYVDGEVDSTEGTWLAGKDGEIAMIMPANPQVGEVFRVENIPPVAFEEITVKAVNVTRNDSPQGPVKGCMVAEELHMDATISEKVFCPGYGEFYTNAKHELEMAALAVPTDALSGPAPVELQSIREAALAVFDAAEKSDWAAAESGAKSIHISWNTFLNANQVPPLLAAQMNRALLAFEGDALNPGMAAKNKDGTRYAAVEVALSGLDLELRYRKVEDVDRDRFSVWALKTILDAETLDFGGVLSDVISLELTRDRIIHTLSKSDADKVNAMLKELRAAAEKEEVTTTPFIVKILKEKIL